MLAGAREIGAFLVRLLGDLAQVELCLLLREACVFNIKCARQPQLFLELLLAGGMVTCMRGSGDRTRDGC